MVLVAFGKYVGHNALLGNTFDALAVEHSIDSNTCSPLIFSTAYSARPLSPHDALQKTARAGKASPLLGRCASG